MNARNMARCALFAALLAICAWIAIPIGDIAFTLQTFGVFLTLGLLGGKRGTLAIFIYLLLGLVGLPVFTGFQGGAGVLLGTTGGYIAGFLFSGLIYWLVTALGGNSHKVRIVAMVLALIICYLFGTAWYRFGYLRSGSAVGVGFILMKCVLPYLVPDLLKLTLAAYLTGRLRPYIS